MGQKIKQKLKKKPHNKEYRNTTYQKGWDAGKAVLREKCTAINAYIKKKKISNE